MKKFQALLSIAAFYLLVSCSFNQEVKEDEDATSHSTLALTEAQFVTTKEDHSVGFDLGQQNDLTLEYRIITPPVNGTTINCFGVTPESRDCEYIPIKDYNGPDSLTYQLVALETGETQTAVIEFNITPVNDSPVLASTIVSRVHVTAGETVKIDLSEATDIDSNSLHYKIEEFPQSGEVKNIDDNILEGAICIYSSDISFEGIERLTYFVEDTEGLLSQVVSVAINVTRAIDSDGDLIPDIQEKSSGTDPYVADIPFVSLDGDFISNLSLKIKNPANGVVKSIGLASTLSSTGKSPLRRYLEYTSFQKYNGEFESLSWKFDARFLHLIPLSNWNIADRERKRFNIQQYIRNHHKFVDHSGEFKLTYGFDLKKIQSVSKIDSLSVGISTLDKILLQPVGVTRSVLQNGSNTTLEFDDNALQFHENLPLFINKLAPNVVNDIISNGHELVGTVENFYITLESGIQTSFKNLIKNIEQKTARIIISTPDKTDVHYVSPNIVSDNDSLLSVLTKLGQTIQLDDFSTILSIGPYSTQFIESIDIYNIPVSYLDKGRWLFFSETKSSLKDPIKANKTYVFSYVTPREMASMHRQQKELGQISKLGKLASNRLPKPHTIFKNVRVGDTITVSITAPTVNQYKITDYTSQVDRWDMEQYCTGTRKVCTKTENVCTETGPRLYQPVDVNKCLRCGTGDGGDNVCVKWEDVCKKWANQCAGYDNRRINQKKCTINYRSYQETRTSLPIIDSISAQYFDRIILQREDGYYWRLSELLPSGFNPIVLKNLNMNNVAIVSKLNISEDIFEQLPMGQLRLTVQAEDPIVEATGYVSNDCTGNHDSFNTSKVNKTFRSEPQFNIDLKLEGNPRRVWR